MLLVYSCCDVQYSCGLLSIYVGAYRVRLSQFESTKSVCKDTSFPSPYECLLSLYASMEGGASQSRRDSTSNFGFISRLVSTVERAAVSVTKPCDLSQFLRFWTFDCDQKNKIAICDFAYTFLRFFTLRQPL